jgi:hypothetical protein
MVKKNAKLWTFLEGIAIGMIIMVSIMTGTRGCSQASADELSEARIQAQMYEERINRLRAEHELASKEYLEVLQWIKVLEKAQAAKEGKGDTVNTDGKAKAGTGSPDKKADGVEGPPGDPKTKNTGS